MFCAEYPYILSVLNHLERCSQISKAQKYDEYLRFCNMLNQLIQLNNLSESIQLIQYNDGETIRKNSFFFFYFIQKKNKIFFEIKMSIIEHCGIKLNKILINGMRNLMMMYSHIQ